MQAETISNMYICSRFKEYFYNSNERNIISLYEDMLRQDSSITLHPLKAPWMMDALHQHYVKRSIKSLTQVSVHCQFYCTGRQRCCREGNTFSRVCLLVCSQVGPHLTTPYDALSSHRSHGLPPSGPTLAVNPYEASPWRDLLSGLVAKRTVGLRLKYFLVTEHQTDTQTSNYNTH